MVRCIAILLAGTSCAVALIAGAANSRAESGPQTHINPYVNQLTAGVADAKPDSLASFTFDGLTIGSTTLDEFKAKYRTFALFTRNEDLSDAKNGVESFTVVGVPNCNGIRCAFLDGTLYQIGVLYQGHRVNNMGGLDSIARKIIARYGAPTNVVTLDKGSAYVWQSSENSRQAIITSASDAVGFYILDTRAESTLSERRAKNANLGF